MIWIASPGDNQFLACCPRPGLLTFCPRGRAIFRGCARDVRDHHLSAGARAWGLCPSLTPLASPPIAGDIAREGVEWTARDVRRDDLTLHDSRGGKLAEGEGVGDGHDCRGQQAAEGEGGLRGGLWRGSMQRSTPGSGRISPEREMRRQSCSLFVIRTHSRPVSRFVYFEPSHCAISPAKRSHGEDHPRGAIRRLERPAGRFSVGRPACEFLRCVWRRSALQP